MGTLQSMLRRKYRASPRLPVELLVIVEEFLVGDNSFRTAANLNLTSRLVYQETAPVLYAVMIWRYDRLVAMNTVASLRLSESWFRHYVKFLIIEDIPQWSDTFWDTNPNSEIFPNIKVLYGCVRPSTMFAPGTYREGHYNWNITTLTVVKPVSCISVVEVVQSLLVTRPPKARLPWRPKRKTLEPQSMDPNAQFRRLRIQHGGSLLQQCTKQGTSKLKPLVHFTNVVVDLGNEPIERMAGDRAETLESMLHLGNEDPFAGTWLTVHCDVSVLPAFMNALALAYLGRSYRHQVWIQLDHPSLSTLVRLLEHWINQCLAVRRQFYDTSNLAEASPILGLLERIAAFEWHDPERTGHRSTELQDNMMDPMAMFALWGTLTSPYRYGTQMSFRLAEGSA